jgi:hypothetical protein
MNDEFGLDGKPWDKPHHIPPLILVREKTAEYEPGWYHLIEQVEGGPFSTWQEAAEAFREYCKTL